MSFYIRKSLKNNFSNYLIFIKSLIKSQIIDSLIYHKKRIFKLLILLSIVFFTGNFIYKVKKTRELQVVSMTEDLRGMNYYIIKDINSEELFEYKTYKNLNTNQIYYDSIDQHSDFGIILISFVVFIFYMIYMLGSWDK